MSSMLFIANLTAQTTFTSDYTLLECQAPIPNSILTSSIKKSEKDIKNNVDEKIGWRDKKKKVDFIIESNYVIDRLLKSHLLLFNTPLNILAEDVLQNLLKDEADLYKGVDLYIVKSSAVNAFATDRGDIFITMGLLARLKTEAELAFILAHEVIHFKEKHSMEAFTEHAEIEEKNRQSYRKTINVLLKKSNYSQSLETIADKKGLDYFAKAGYTFNDATNVFDILQMGHAAVYNLPADKSIFELNYIKIDTADWLKKVSKIEPLEDDDENYQTHPDIDKRKDALDENRTYYKVDGRSPYQVKTKEAFANVIMMAQFELLQILLQEMEYVRAIYLASALQTQYPENAFLKKNFAYALYGLAEYALLDELELVLYSHESVQGEWERINHLFDGLSPKEIAVIAGVFCWEAHLAYPKDEKIKRMARDLIEDIVIYEAVEDPMHYFAKAPIDTSILNSTSSFARFCFSEYMADSTFTGHLKRGLVYKKRRKEKEEEKETKAYQREKKKEKRDGKSIGAKKIVVINPEFLKGTVSRREGAKLNFEDSEKGQKDLIKYIKETGKSIKLPTKILDINRLKNGDEITTFNDIHIVEHWTDEFFSHPTYIVATNHNKAMAICDKYDAKYFVHTGFVSIKDKRRLRRNISKSGLNYLASIVYAAILPYAVYKTVRRRRQNETYFYLNAINMKNYSLDLSDSNWINFKAKPALLKTHIYWSFNQLKRKKK